MYYWYKNKWRKVEIIHDGCTGAYYCVDVDDVWEKVDIKELLKESG